MCPACRLPMVVFELDGVEIDRCLKCAGTWLDAGEIDQIARMSGAAPGSLSAALEQGSDEKDGERRCLRCSAKLRIVKIRDVEIDRCPHGHGLWFDRSEMETLIGSLTDGEDGAVARILGELNPSKLKKGD